MGFAGSTAITFVRAVTTVVVNRDHSSCKTGLPLKQSTFSQILFVISKLKLKEIAVLIITRTITSIQWYCDRPL